MKNKTINGWTKDSMKEAILKYNNGTQAFNLESQTCEYLTRDGNRCAVGCFAPDNEELQESGLDVMDAAAYIDGLRNTLPLDPLKLLPLQHKHDDFDSRKGKTLHMTLLNWIDENVE